MTQLYPEIEPKISDMLNVSSLHSIHYEVCGNMDGPAILFVHGGPGGGINPTQRRFFDPKKWKIVLFSQRGCGQSLPYAELRENTTQDLVADMEKLRDHLGIERWTLFGGSWGSTLALVYGIQHSHRVDGFVLRGIFLSRKKELDWLYQLGASKVFADAFADYVKPIPENERFNLMAAYHKRLTSDNVKMRHEAAKAWSMWETSISRLVPDEERVASSGEIGFAEAFARIECHYFMNGSFLPSDDYILENTDAIKDIPMSIVQGRYDMVCPAESAFELHWKCPLSKLIIAKKSGHSPLEEEMVTALVDETNEMFVKRQKA